MKAYRCVYKNCSQKIGKKSTVEYARFVKPRTDIIRAKEWISLIGNPDLKIEHIDEYTVLCEKHFVSDADLDWRRNETLKPFHHALQVVPSRNKSNRQTIGRIKNLPERPNSPDLKVLSTTSPITYQKQYSKAKSFNFDKIDIKGRLKL